jgi:hypothetical protein
MTIDASKVVRAIVASIATTYYKLSASVGIIHLIIPLDKQTLEASQRQIRHIGDLLIGDQA